MAREQLPYFNPSTDGQGLEGLINFANASVGYWMIPAFLFVFYSLSIYVLSKSEYRMGSIVMYTSVLFFILGMIAQTFTQFNQLVMFVFAIGGIVGLVMTFVENARV